MSIYITSNTKSKSGNENLTNNFTMHLVHPIDALNKDAYLDVQNVCYPLTTKNIDEENFHFKFAFDITKFMKNKTGQTNYNEVVIYESQIYHIPTGIYDLNRLLDYMNNILKEYDIDFTLEKSGKVHLNVNLALEYWLIQYNKQIAHDGGVCEKFRLSSKDAKIGFTIQMSEKLSFMLGFKKSLIKLNNETDTFIEVKADFLPDVSDGLNKMFIYCEELEATLVGDSYSELLTTVPIQWSGQGQGNGTLNCFSPAKQLRKFKKSIINDLHIKIKDTADKLIPFDSGTVSLDCIIHYA